MDQNVAQKAPLLNRLDRIPIWPYPNYFLLIIGIGFFFSFFDIITIGLSLPKIEMQFHISASQAVWTITSSLAGYIVGSFLDSRVSDLFGRRPALIISIVLFSAGSIFSAFSFQLSTLIFWRFITGMGIGSEIANISTYLCEISPSKIRGKLTCTAIAFGMLGFAVVPFIALLLVPHFSWGWRALFVIGGIGGILVFFMRSKILPESPRWLIAKGKSEKAEEIICRNEQFARQKLGTELPPINNQYIDASPSNLWQTLTSPYLKQIILFATLWFFYYIGNYAWLTLGTNLLVKKGFTLGSSLIFISITSLGFIAGSLLAIFFSDKIQRKWSAAITALIWSVALLIIGWIPNTFTIITAGFIASTTIAMIIPILYTLTAESFPTASRNTCVSITDGVGHLGGAFCGQITFAAYYVFEKMHAGFAGALSLMALTGIITAILLIFGRSMTNKQVK